MLLIAATHLQISLNDPFILVPAVVGFGAGLIGGLLGVGGSVLIIPALVIYLGHTPHGYTGTEQHLLQAAAMICNVFVSAPAVVAHLRAKAVMGRVVRILVPTAWVSIALGVATSNSVLFARQNGAYLAMLLAAFLVYVAGYNAWRLWSQEDLSRKFDPACPIGPIRVVLVGTLMGFSAGLLGIGGGALCVPLQQLLLKIPLRIAIANSATTIVFIAALGAVLKNATLYQHGLSWLDSVQLAAVLVPGAILGSYLGARLTHALPRRVLRAVFVIFMLTMAALLFGRAWQAVHG